MCVNGGTVASSYAQWECTFYSWPEASMSNVLRVLWAMTRPLWRNHHIHNPLLTQSPADPLPFTTPLALASSIVDCQNLGQPHRLEDRAHFRFQFSFAFRPRSAVWISTVCWYGSRCNVHVHFEWERTYFVERLNHSLFSNCHTSEFCLWYSYNTYLRAWIRIYTKNHTKIALVVLFFLESSLKYGITKGKI